MLDLLVERGDYQDMLMQSHFARPTPVLLRFARELDLKRRDDPLTRIRELNAVIYNAFDYVLQSTSADSPIDEALEARKGVCQEYAHILTALARHLRAPCRYVSGYLLHRVEYNDRCSQDASHARVEALLRELGWVGFDPTNHLLDGQGHVRVAVGRDHSDVPPTRGVFKGAAESELSVAVQVKPAEEPDSEKRPASSPRSTARPSPIRPRSNNSNSDARGIAVDTRHLRLLKLLQLPACADSPRPG